MALKLCLRGRREKIAERCDAACITGQQGSHRQRHVAWRQVLQAHSRHGALSRHSLHRQIPPEIPAIQPGQWQPNSKSCQGQGLLVHLRFTIFTKPRPCGSCRCEVRENPSHVLGWNPTSRIGDDDATLTPRLDYIDLDLRQPAILGSILDSSSGRVLEDLRQDVVHMRRNVREIAHRAAHLNSWCSTVESTANRPHSVRGLSRNLHAVEITSDG
mmetsp:Transcript_32264/g.77306  ORF Transcript_32264/g.77306 Transcript_32264/m.77306 type:complete len:215 (-) Transcript_32264:569-1213(-)